MAGLVRSLHSLLPRTSIPCRAMAGHSKWSNIRHVKGAKDAKFQKIAGRISQRIRTVIREGGSNDPKYNFLLARIITEAKSLDIPKSTIENAIKGSSKGKEAAVVHFIEGKGVGNCFIIVETYTERTKHIRQQIQHVLKKFSGSIGQSGFASHSYVNKGCVYVPLKSKEGAVVDADIDNKLSVYINVHGSSLVLWPTILLLPPCPYTMVYKTLTPYNARTLAYKAMTMDDAENIAIEVDSEEVNEDYDEDGTRVFKFITDQKCLHTVKAAIEAIPLAVSEARLEYIAQVKVHLDQKQLVSFADMMTALREQEDVIRIYHNIDNETDIDSALEAVSKS